MMRTFEAALREIASFGLRNPGYGFSCARIAQDALSEAAAAQGIEAGTGETQSGSTAKPRKPGRLQADAPEQSQ